MNALVMFPKPLSAFVRGDERLVALLGYSRDPDRDLVLAVDNESLTWLYADDVLVRDSTTRFFSAKQIAEAMRP